MISIEIWEKAFKGKIPKGEYEMLLQNGEKDGLIITLSSVRHNVFINFGAVSAIRMLDEGIVLNNLFDDKQIEEFRKHGFDNTIYQILDGEFDRFVRKIGGDLCDCLNFKHYIVVSLNFIVEIITEWEPNIVIENKCVYPK